MRAQLAGWRELSADEMARRRIEAGIPAVPADLGPGDLPNEGGLEADAISYTKGCYLGQEVMARLKAMGTVRRRLVRVAWAGEEILTLPAALFLGARQVGELRSAAPEAKGGAIGLAMVSLLQVTAGRVARAGGGRAGDDHRDRLGMTELEQLTEVCTRLGAPPAQARTMAAQLLKRAEQLAVERGTARETELARLLNLVMQGRAGVVPAEFAPPPAGPPAAD